MDVVVIIAIANHAVTDVYVLTQSPSYSLTTSRESTACRK